MTAAAILTQGTTFSIDDVGGSTPTIISGVQSVTGIGSGKATEINVTTLASTAKEFRMGLQDFGSFVMNFNWDQNDAGQLEMYTKMGTQTPAKFVMVLPATNPTITIHTWTATVYIVEMAAEVAADGVVKGTATLRVTGAPAWS